MNKIILILVIAIFAVSCADNNTIETEILKSYDDGAVHVERDYKTVDDKKLYTYEREYYKDGKLLKEGFLNDKGRRNGVWKSYYRDGVLWSEGNFANGRREGKTMTFFTNGNKYYEGVYANAKKSGIWKFWNEQGEFVKEVDYDKK